MKKLNRECPVCKSKCGEELYQMNFAEIKGGILSNRYWIVACKLCGMVFADTSNSQKEYDKYYEIMSKYEEISATGSGEMLYDKKRLESTALLIERYLVNRNAKVLDIGCANGGLLQELKKLGCDNIEGIDPSSVCVSNTLNKDIKARCANISQEVNRKNKYDCIILAHVLEHIRDLREMVNYLTCMLNDNGVLYIEVPNAAKYDEYYVVPFYYFDMEHINHFDNISLGNLFNNIVKVYEEECFIQVNNKIKYPVLKMIFKKTKSIENKTEYISATSAKLSISDYLDKSKEDLRFRKLEKLEQSQEEILVWGAGQYALRLMANSKLKNCNIKGFIDNDRNRQEKLISGVPVYSKEILENFNGTIVIATALANEQIEKELRINKIYNTLIQI